MKQETEIRTKYGIRKRKGLVTPEPSRTKQSFRDECDINNVMKKFERTGILPEMIKQNPQYGDFSDVESFQEAQNIVIHANEQFMALDAHIRKRFDNNPAKFLEFVSYPENLDEMVKLGIATKKEKKEATPPDVPSETRTQQQPPKP